VIHAPLEIVLLSLESGARPKGGVSADSGEIPSLGGEHVNSDGGFDFTNIKRIPRSFFEKMRSGLIAPLDILIVKDGATTGKTSLVRDDFPFPEAAVNEHVFCVRVNPEQASPTFIYHFLRSDRGQEAIQLDFRGATVGGISREFAAKTVVPLPPLATQRRIAEILDRAEMLRAKRRATLAQLDTLTQAIFLDLFRDETSNNWPEPEIASLAMDKPNAIRTGPFGSQLLHSEFVDSGIAVLGIDNAVQNKFIWARPRFITEKKYRQLQRYKVFPGDVLITIMGTCGRCAVVPYEIPTTINTKHLCCISLDQSRCLPLYLQACFLLHTKVQHRLGIRERGAVMPGLNMQIIKELRVPLPPLDLQREFAHRVATVEKLKTAHSASLVEMDALFAALQHRAFRGEL
jgi:type I restriction enzyme, S subunit